MAVFETWLESDLQKPVIVKKIAGAVFTQDNDANLVGVIVTDGGEPVTLSGTVYGYVIIPTGETVEIEGTIDGNKAYFVLSQECYVNGHISIAIKLTDGTTITTLGACSAYVYKSKTSNEVVPTGTPIPDLSVVEEAIGTYAEAAEDSAEDSEAYAIGKRGGVDVESTDPTYHNNSKYYSEVAQTAATSASAAYGTNLLAPTYSATATYAVGDHVIYNGGYYECNTAISTAEAWTSAHWTQLTVGGETSALKSAIDSMDGGTTGQVLRKKSNTDKDWEWAGVAQPTDAQVEDAVDDWLTDHPEATTTVQDASLTESKFTAQTILDYKNYVVTPQMYGALANGSHDDTEAIQAALDANYKVYFPIGTYKITEPLTIRGGTTIEGSSKYNSTIMAYGCDCFHMISGDSGERGHIYNIHLRGNKTAGTKGIKLAGSASGWTIDTVWLDDFDYCVYGYRVGSVNNIYISQCIMTGNLQDYDDMTAGVYMPHAANLGPINAITVRDCEINFFKYGIAIGGTALSIVQNTIQAIDYGVISDAWLGKSEGGTTGYVGTYGMIISGNYFEKVNKSAIFLNSAIMDGNTVSTCIGFFNGVQITNNYILKDNSGDNSYACIKLQKSTTYPGKYTNFGIPTGLEYSMMFIGMNNINKPSGCKRYDLDCCLSKDSIFMDSIAGGTAYITAEEADLSPRFTGARMITSNMAIKEGSTFYSYPFFNNANVTMQDEKTAILAPNGLVKIFLNRNNLNKISLLLKATTYPFKLRYIVGVRSAIDGILYQSFSNDGFFRDIEDTDWVAGATYSTFNSSEVQSDGYIHKDIFTMQENCNDSVTWNSVSGFVVILCSKESSQNIEIKAPTYEWIR